MGDESAVRAHRGSARCSGPRRRRGDPHRSERGRSPTRSRSLLRRAARRSTCQHEPTVILVRSARSNGTGKTTDDRQSSRRSCRSNGTQASSSPRPDTFPRAAAGGEQLEILVGDARRPAPTSSSSEVAGGDDPAAVPPSTPSKAAQIARGPRTVRQSVDNGRAGLHTAGRISWKELAKVAPRHRVEARRRTTRDASSVRPGRDGRARNGLQQARLFRRDRPAVTGVSRGRALETDAGRPFQPGSLRTPIMSRYLENGG